MHHGLSKGKTSEITSCIKLKVVKMVNGNYVLYGDRPSSESEIVDDHVHSRSNDRKNKRKVNRTANELQHSLNLAQLDNETDSVKYEKKIKEPRLLRYVPTTDVEENYVTEKFETYDLKPTEERPRRYAFTKKPKNPADGSVNYAYSRSSSSCSSPNGNLPTISEHGEQYGTYRAHAMPSPAVNDLIAGYDTKLDKYFSKPRDVKPFTTKVGYIGSHPDSLYRVAADSSAGAGKVTRVLRVLRWPVALVAVCVALAVFVYFLMPDNLESRSENDNATYWEPVVAAGHRPYSAGHGRDHYNKKPESDHEHVQCRSTHMALCRGVLPYDLAGVSAKVGEVEITSLLSQIDYLVASNCSDRVRHFACALLEPECNPPPYPAKMPCYSLCKAIVDSCDGHIPSELMPAFNCKQYSRTNCVSAKTPCYSREFECSDNSCVPRDWMCDGTKDCPAGEDEASCVRCDQSEYRCSTGGCILKRWLCDGYADCPGGEDEHESTCGARHVNIPSEPRLHSAADTHSLDAAVDTHEPGEESAGSAPAPAVRRPNRVPVGRKGHYRAGENDSSKELLITSDSNNGFKRNYTRRPLPSRLSHYYRPQSSRVTDADEAPDNASMKRSDTRKSEGEKTTPKNILENESIEDVNMGDLGFFEEFEKDTKESTSPAHRVKPKIGGVPTPRPPPMAPLPATQTTRLDKTANKLDRVIDGAALLRKAVAAQAADTIDEMAEMNSTDIDKDDMAPGADSPTENNKTGGTSLMTTGRTTNKDDANRPNKKGPGRVKSDGDRNWAAAHTSPCPSGELRCVDGRCITLAQLCDGTIDCSDHADEDNCYT
ncbi:uncharacterized protein LOC113502003 isoform X5 [Trichoplusia ni]|uniref:Uncharacterized protein LOC113502003 isoform X5 n=1 Tax=Trichoplusia ni TaxID=7111 RepID=A0A7E5WEM8_TRINI|nr:uncharacterized protein LOC113502003 isoform X5 [Trichoplusia ni]